VATETNFHGNSDENPDQVKKPIHGYIDKLSWKYRRKSRPIYKKHENNRNVEKFRGIIRPYLVVLGLLTNPKLVM